jgi:general secretion pathway protein L
MTDWLLLRLPPDEDGPVSWALADAAGQLMSLPSSDTGAGLHTVSVGRRIALLVPGADVVHLHAVVPVGSEARALQLVPFALEDQLSQDVDQLHFAIGSRDATSGTVPVAVMERVRMQQWLARATA